VERLSTYFFGTVVAGLLGVAGEGDTGLLTSGAPLFSVLGGTGFPFSPDCLSAMISPSASIYFLFFGEGFGGEAGRAGTGIPSGT